jgi:hypothetical protein
VVEELFVGEVVQWSDITVPFHKAAIRVRLFISATTASRRKSAATGAAALAMKAVTGSGDSGVRGGGGYRRGGGSKRDSVLGTVIIPLTDIAARQEEIEFGGGVSKWAEDEVAEGVAAVVTEAETEWNATSGFELTPTTKMGRDSSGGEEGGGRGSEEGEREINLDTTTPWVDKWLDLDDYSSRNNNNNISSSMASMASMGSMDSFSLPKSDNNNNNNKSLNTNNQLFGNKNGGGTPKRTSALSAFLGSDSRNARAGPPPSKVVTTTKEGKTNVFSEICV